MNSAAVPARHLSWRVGRLKALLLIATCVAIGAVPSLPGVQSASALDPTDVLSTIAGSGVVGFSGDGGSATSASFNRLGGVAVDAEGNVYVADTGNHRVRKIATNGVVSTFVGTGIRGDDGDGGPATDAQLRSPGSLTFDSAGNLYIRTLYRIRRVDTQGRITTYAGGGDFWGNTHSCVGRGPGCDDGVVATETRVYAGILGGLAFDRGGNLYFAETSVSRIRMVNPDGVISTVAGTFGKEGYAGDTGPARLALLAGPQHLVVDGQDNVYFADQGSLGRRVRMIRDGIITSVVFQAQTLDQNADVYGGAFITCCGVVPTIGPGDELYFADIDHKLQRFDGITSTVLSRGMNRDSGLNHGDGLPVRLGDIGTAIAMTFDRDGNLYVADEDYTLVRKVTFVKKPVAIGGQGNPRG